MLAPLTQLVVALLALASASAVDDNKRKKDKREVDLNLDALQKLHMIKKQYDDLRAELESEDEDAPGGSLDYSHTQPFHTTQEDQAEYNLALEDEMYLQYQDDYFSTYGGKAAHNLHVQQIARPEGAETGYYTGVTHFNHVNDPSLVTILFSAGRHDGGANTFLTINTRHTNPFEGAQEQYVDGDVSTWTWVSTYTLVNDDEDSVKHYALFSGGRGGGVTGPSRLYVFEEDVDGSLQEPYVVWDEPLKENQRESARFCLIADLGVIYNSDLEQVSMSGFPDVVIAGTKGLDIYSSMDEISWNLARNLTIEYSFEDDTAALLGAQAVDQKYLIVGARARSAERGNPDVRSYSFVYDYQEDIVVQRFAGKPQSVSVAVLDDGSQMLLGSGSQASLTGAPNLLYDVTYEDDTMITGRTKELKKIVTGRRNLKTKNTNLEKQHKKYEIRQRKHADIEENMNNSKGSKKDMQSKGSKKDVHPKGSKSPTKSKAGKESRKNLSLKVADTQHARGTPLDFTTFDSHDSTPVSSKEYFVVPGPGYTKTRQVLAFQVDGYDVDFVLEVNSAQTCNIYYREKKNEFATKVLPLPGSEGYLDNVDFNDVLARAGDAFDIDGTLYVIISLFNGNNTVYSFSTDVFDN